MHLWPIAQVTVKESLRFRILYFIFGVALLFILIGKGCNPGTVKGTGILFDERALVAFAMHMAFHGIAFWSMILCGLLASQVLNREIESGTAALTLSRPVRRSTFVAGKLLAVSMVSVLNLFVLGTIFICLLYSEIGRVDLRIYAGLCIVIPGMVLFALLNMLLSLLLPRLPALMIGLLTYCTAFLCSVPTHIRRITLLWEPSSAITTLHTVLPALGDLQFIAAGSIAAMPDAGAMVAPALNCVLYLCLLWYATIVLFEKKQL
jgi:ABC-type transport system involved in multi-copper enzyme maturation permease subunit